MQIIESYNIPIDEAISSLRELKASKILLQSPLGLRSVAHHIAEILKLEGFEVTFSSSNCWGGCDVAYTEAKSVKVDAIIHLGHSRFLRRDRHPTIYLEARYADPTPIQGIVGKIIAQLDGLKRVGIGASVQWLDFVQYLCNVLEENGVETFTAKPNMFSLYEAQVLGCDVSSLKKIEEVVDGFVVLGSVFHGLGMAISSTKPVVAADPHSQQVKNLSTFREKILKTRFAQITAFKNASKVGVVVSVKPGQKRIALAKRLNTLLNEKGKQSYLLSADEVTTSTVSENRFDAFVNTACPRLSIEDQSVFSKPLLLPVEALVSLGLIEWEEVVDKGFLMYPWGWYSREVGERIWKAVSAVQL